jgi:hypothetical protein
VMVCVWGTHKITQGLLFKPIQSSSCQRVVVEQKEVKKRSLRE